MPERPKFDETNKHKPVAVQWGSPNINSDSSKLTTHLHVKT